jgi:flagellar biosynthesis/type III secretory pathway M-ring protein FliF/YscJ
MSGSRAEGIRTMLAQADQSDHLYQLLAAVVPWLVVFATLWFFLFKVLRKRTASSAQYLEESRRHMAAVESKLDRVIELLEYRAEK